MRRDLGRNFLLNSQLTIKSRQVSGNGREPFTKTPSGKAISNRQMIDANKSLQIEQENKGLSEKLAELKEKCRSYERTQKENEKSYNELKQQLSKKTAWVNQLEKKLSLMQKGKGLKQDSLRQMDLTAKRLQESLSEAERRYSALNKRLQLRQQLANDKEKKLVDRVADAQQQTLKIEKDYNRTLERMRELQASMQTSSRDREKVHSDEKNKMKKTIAELEERLRNIILQRDAALQSVAKSTELPSKSAQIISALQEELVQQKKQKEAMSNLLKKEAERIRQLQEEILELRSSQENNGGYKMKYLEGINTSKITNDTVTQLRMQVKKEQQKWQKVSAELQQQKKTNREGILRENTQREQLESSRKKLDQQSIDLQKWKMRVSQVQTKLQSSKEKAAQDSKQLQQFRQLATKRSALLTQNQEKFALEVESLKEQLDLVRSCSNQSESRLKVLQQELAREQQKNKLVSQSLHSLQENHSQSKLELTTLVSTIDSLRLKQRQYRQENTLSKSTITEYLNTINELKVKLQSQSQKVKQTTVTLHGNERQFETQIVNLKTDYEYRITQLTTEQRLNQNLITELKVTVAEKDQQLMLLQSKVEDIEIRFQTDKQKHRLMINKLKQELTDITSNYQQQLKQSQEVLENKHNSLVATHNQLVLKDNEIAYMHHQLQETDNQLRQIDERLAYSEGELNITRSKLKSVQQQLDEVNSQRKNISQQCSLAKGMLQSVSNELAVVYNELRGSRNMHQTSHSELQRQLISIQSQMSQSQSALSVCQSKMNASSRSLQETTEKLRKTELLLRQNQTSLQLKQQQLRSRSEKYETEIQSMKENYENALLQVSKQCSRLHSDLLNIQEKLRRSQKEKEDSVAKVTAFEKFANELASAKVNLQKDKTWLREENNTLTNRLGTITAQADDLRNQLRMNLRNISEQQQRELERNINAMEQLQQTCRNLEKSKNEAWLKVKTLQHELVSNNQEQTVLATKNETLVKTIQEMREQQKIKNKQVVQQSQQMKQLSQKLQSTSKDVTSISKQLNEERKLRAQFEMTANSSKNITSEMENRLKTTHQSYQKMLNEAREQEKKQANRVQQLSKYLETTKLSKQSLLQQNNKLVNQLQLKSMILLQTEGKINQSALVVQNSAELQEARIKIGELTRLLNEAKETNLEKDLIISQITAQGQSHIAKIKSIEGEIFNRDKWYSEQFINMQKENHSVRQAYAQLQQAFLENQRQFGERERALTTEINNLMAVNLNLHNQFSQQQNRLKEQSERIANDDKRIAMLTAELQRCVEAWEQQKSMIQYTKIRPLSNSDSSSRSSSSHIIKSQSMHQQVYTDKK